MAHAWRQVAERAVTIGAAPDGQAETVAGSTEIEPLPPGVLGDQAVIDAMATRLAEVTARTRERIERTAGVDPVSEDLLIRIAGSLEKQLWLIRAQRDRA
jgi:starvation-inducible DNA-binding protein